MPIVRETALRSWRRTLRRPTPLTFSFVQPLVWLLVFGFLFHRFELGPELEGIGYLDYLLPGVCAMTVLFGASQGGIALVRDAQTGFLQRMLRTTEHPGCILTGELVALIARLLLQAVLLVLLGLAIGAELRPDATGMLTGVTALLLFAIGYGALSMAVALGSNNAETMATFVHLLNMPLLFTSTALVPHRQMPEWLATIAHWNPLSLAAEALRHGLLATPVRSASEVLLPLLLLATVSFGIGRWQLERTSRRPVT